LLSLFLRSFDAIIGCNNAIEDFPPFRHPVCSFSGLHGSTLGCGHNMGLLALTSRWMSTNSSSVNFLGSRYKIGG
jgi:hypothetical protein